MFPADFVRNELDFGESTMQQDWRCSTIVSISLVLLSVAALRIYDTNALAAETIQALQASAPYGIIASPNVMVAMRDGVQLATNIYRPSVNGSAAPGKFPAILERTPYDKD